MAGDSLPLDDGPVARFRRKRHMGKRGRVHVPARVEQLLADGDRLGERPAGVFERDEHEVAERMVARYGEAVFECSRERVGRVGRHGSDALADVAGGRDVGFLAQDAGRAAVVGHGDHGARLHPEREERADGHGGPGAAADDDGAQFARAVALDRADEGKVAKRSERRGGRRVLREGAFLHHGPTSPPGARRARGRGARRSRGSRSTSGNRRSIRRSRRFDAGRPCSRWRWRAAACPRPRSRA